jgi:hypothetical protein
MTGTVRMTFGLKLYECWSGKVKMEDVRAMRPKLVEDDV